MMDFKIYGPKSPTKNFKFKNCLFCATNIVKNSDKKKWI